MLSNLVLWCSTVSKFDDNVFNIPGLNISSQNMEPYQFAYFLAAIKAVGCTVAFFAKDGDIGACMILYYFFKTAKKVPCWLHKLRTLWKKVSNAGKEVLTFKTKPKGKIDCGCTHKNTPTQPMNHLKPTSQFATKVQGVLLRAFCLVCQMAPRYFSDGSLNDKWPGIVAIRNAVIKEVDIGLNHLFNIDHSQCSHDPLNPSAIRSGHYVTCAWIQDKIKKLIYSTLEFSKDIADALLWNNVTGLAVTNACESAIGKIALFRIKGVNYSAFRNRLLVMWGVINVQALRLFLFTGNCVLVPEFEILQIVEELFGFEKGSVVNQRAKDAYEKKLRERKKQAEKEKKKEWKEKAARMKKEREAKKKEDGDSRDKVDIRIRHVPGYDDTHAGGNEKADAKGLAKMKKEEEEDAKARLKAGMLGAAAAAGVGLEVFAGVAAVEGIVKKRKASRCGHCRCLGHRRPKCPVLDIQKRTEEVLKEQESLERVEAARRFEKGCTVWLFLPVEEQEAPWVECLVYAIPSLKFAFYLYIH
jgi:hypothetical protein